MKTAPRPMVKEETTFSSISAADMNLESRTCRKISVHGSEVNTKVDDCMTALLLAILKTSYQPASRPATSSCHRQNTAQSRQHPAFENGCITHHNLSRSLATISKETFFHFIQFIVVHARTVYATWSSHWSNTFQFSCLRYSDYSGARRVKWTRLLKRPTSTGLWPRSAQEAYISTKELSQETFQQQLCLLLPTKNSRKQAPFSPIPMPKSVSVRVAKLEILLKKMLLPQPFSSHIPQLSPETALEILYTIRARLSKEKRQSFASSYLCFTFTAILSFANVLRAELLHTMDP